ncbi:MAG: type II CRISPR-associated endonuclease Cas1 [Acidimicrobiales bacterium]|nr:type II CRISPR-associated endonuclease Cas1 [Acidimicrobiales bacterium]
MTENRILDISESGAHLHLLNSNLVVDRTDNEPVLIPITDLASVCISHPSITISKSVMSALAEEGIALVICDDKFMPSGMLLPIHSHYLQSRRFADQAAAALPTKKRLWQQVVRAKIRAQAKILLEVRGSDEDLTSLVKQVRSGDVTNVEATAARRYWSALFSGTSFRRDRFGNWPNPALNYGYAILRAIVARSICTSGLHPSLGLHHSNQYNPFCLADDLMEPYRPTVDLVIATKFKQEREDNSLQREDRAVLISALYGRFNFGNESRSLFDVLSRMTSSLAAVFEGSGTNLAIATPG